MSDNKNANVVIATFANEQAAKDAVDAIKTWDKANDDVKLGAVGTITRDEDGKVKTHLGRKAGRGATVGVVLGLIAAVLSGGVGLVGGLVGGAALGGVVGAFFKKSANLSKEDIQQIGEELSGGGAAVVVACDAYEIADTENQLREAGGTVRSFELPEEAIDEAAEAAVEEGETEMEVVAEDASDAADEAVAEATEASEDAGDESETPAV